MTLKEVYAILKEIEDHVEDTCCAITMDPLDIKDLITKLRKAIHSYSQQK
tara:strand:- start:86 stop:235 length:150 start_codon:yes stop_codon:yes gene_type:complete